MDFTREDLDKVQALKDEFRLDRDSHVMVWDRNGRYKGQWQPDALSEEPTAGEIFIKPPHDYAGEWDLSQSDLNMIAKGDVTISGSLYNLAGG